MRLAHSTVIVAFLFLAIHATTDIQPAGIYVRLNQRAVDYMADVASEAFPAILNKLHPPNITTGVATIANLVLSNIARPSIKAKFLNEKGIEYNISLASFRADAYAEISIFIFSYSGTFTAQLDHLNIHSELHFNHNGTTVVTAPVCNVTQSDLSLVFPKNSALITLQSDIKSTIVESLRDAVCTTAVDALTFVMSQKPVQPEHPDFIKPEPNDANGFNIVEFGSSLCVPEKLNEIDDAVTTPTPDNETNQNNTDSSYWGIDLSVNHPPTFSDDDMIIGLDGGLMYNGWKAESAPQPNVLNRTLLDKKMIGILVSEYIPNTLFHHVYMNDLGSFKHKYTPASLPKILQKLSKAVCSNCFLEISANLTEQPRLEIDEHLGARIEVSANISVTFQGREKMHDMLHANTKLHITLKPTIRHSRLFGDVSLTNVDVNIFDLGLGGPLAAPIEKLFSFVVPRILWPQVKKRLRFAMNHRGVKLPTMCGIEFEHTELDFVDHAVVINTDFTFDVQLFIRKFKNYLIEKSKYNPNMPNYVEL
ncbi:unnamed protein product [Caenorhabditis bovis]|uniref:Lipid-binding serum glycoprotein C-terminal domain-containing protein n=1 Tax=Caenorhabditis bovis TaxID=2654633 RepID=A0A8S1E3A4_9PELO|nr:unnamed protein product [Caenorhabditis bovis]